MTPDWFNGWVLRHEARHTDTAPDHETEAGAADYALIAQRFAELGTTEAQADGITDALRGEAPTARTHVRAVILLAEESGHPNPAAAGTLDQARARSRHCGECGGDGITARYVWHARRGFAYRQGFCCHRCRAGRWLADHYARRPPGESRIPDLAEHPSYHDERLRFEWNEAYVMSVAPY